MPRAIRSTRCPPPTTSGAAPCAACGALAVVRFSGLAHEPDIQQKTTELKAFIAATAGGRRPALPGAVQPPWTLWFMRRNEIMIPVQGEAAR